VGQRRRRVGHRHEAPAADAQHRVRRAERAAQHGLAVAVGQSQQRRVRDRDRHAVHAGLHRVDGEVDVTAERLPAVLDRAVGAEVLELAPGGDVERPGPVDAALGGLVPGHVAHAAGDERVDGPPCRVVHLAAHDLQEAQLDVDRGRVALDEALHHGQRRWFLSAERRYGHSR
jgi:hypothetical protein